MALAEPLRVQKRGVPALTPADARRILAAVRGDRLEALFTVALSVGLRQSEALGLRWADVDLDGASLTVRRALQRAGGEWRFDEPQSDRSNRTVALPGPVVTALREHRAQQIGERLRAGPAWCGDDWGDLVFASETGEPLDGTSVGKRFKRLLAAAGLPDMRYHHLRHGVASLMAAHGVPPRVAMEVPGHVQISTTMNIYSHVHVGDETARLAADRVESAIWGAS